MEKTDRKTDMFSALIKNKTNEPIQIIVPIKAPVLELVRPMVKRMKPSLIK